MPGRAGPKPALERVRIAVGDRFPAAGACWPNRRKHPFVEIDPAMARHGGANCGEAAAMPSQAGLAVGTHERLHLPHGTVAPAGTTQAGISARWALAGHCGTVICSPGR